MLLRLVPMLRCNKVSSNLIQVAVWMFMYFGIPCTYISVVWSSAEKFSNYTLVTNGVQVRYFCLLKKHIGLKTCMPFILLYRHHQTYVKEKKITQKTNKSTKNIINSFYDLPCCWSWWNKTASAQLSDLDLIWLGFSWMPMEWKDAVMLISTLLMMEYNSFAPTKY